MRMNCPVCGAENEVGARFCTECGAPLENTLNLPPTPPEVEDEDDDRTIMSANLSRLAEEAKTVSVTQEQLAAAEAQAVAGSGSSAAGPASSPVSPVSSGSSGGQGWMTRRNLIIIGVVVVLLLLCCCCSIIIGGILADPEMMRQLENLGLMSTLYMLI